MSDSDDQLNNTVRAVPLREGSTLAQYRVERKLGQGGMGEVYLAVDTTLNRSVALKFLPAQFCSDKEMIARFTREAQAAARLDHPNVVTIHEVGDYEGRPYFVMSHIEGTTLSRHITENSPDVDTIIGLFVQITEGLQAAHKKGIIHRDIKPANIVVDQEGRPRIVDFGLATLNDSNDLTRTGSTLGTFGYMSPEQARGEKISPASDLFSLGVMLYESLCGERPFGGDNQAAILYNIVHSDHPPLQSKLSTAPIPLAHIVDKLLQKSTASRYTSADQLLHDLKSLQSGASTRIAAVAQPPRHETPSIAVLPFANMSADPENEYFSDGITEEIINSLSQLQDLHVAARTSSFFFKNKSTDIREVGEKLQVKTMLEGSVRRSGDKIRVTAQLINVEDGYHLWSERFDRKVDDIFAIQDEIAGSITEKLKVTLSHSEKDALIRHGTSNMQAYDLYLRGRFYWEQRGGKLVNALSFYQNAIELDPHYALAYVGIADAYHMMALYGIEPPRECMPKAKAAALKALELDPELAEAHTPLAMVSLMFDRDWAKAKELFERANSLNPRHVQNRYWYAYWYLYMYEHDLEGALAEARRGIEIDPLAALPSVHYALILWMERRNDEVLAIMNEIMERDPLAYKSYWWLVGNCLCDAGDCEGALAVCPPVEKSLHRHQWSVAFHGHILSVCGRREEAEILQAELERRSQTEYIANFSLALIPLSLGQTDRALAFLATVSETRDPGIITVARWPLFSKIQEHPRFLEILKSENLLK